MSYNLAVLAIDEFESKREDLVFAAIAAKLWKNLPLV